MVMKELHARNLSIGDLVINLDHKTIDTYSYGIVLSETKIVSLKDSGMLMKSAPILCYLIDSPCEAEQTIKDNIISAYRKHNIDKAKKEESDRQGNKLLKRNKEKLTNQLRNSDLYGIGAVLTRPYPNSKGRWSEDYIYIGYVRISADTSSFPLEYLMLTQQYKNKYTIEGHAYIRKDTVEVIDTTSIDAFLESTLKKYLSESHDSNGYWEYKSGTNANAIFTKNPSKAFTVIKDNLCKNMEKEDLDAINSLSLSNPKEIIIDDEVWRYIPGMIYSVWTKNQLSFPVKIKVEWLGIGV